jgi:hypothetical protein
MGAVLSACSLPNPSELGSDGGGRQGRDGGPLGGADATTGDAGPDSLPGDAEVGPEDSGANTDTYADADASGQQDADAAGEPSDAKAFEACAINACGGCSVLSAAPASSCGKCGVNRCASESAITCDDPGLNACGGCGTLLGAPGATCGCNNKYTYACTADKTAVACTDPGANACGGCGTLTAAPGAACGSCGAYACSADKTAVTCSDPGLNACGGCGTLTGAPGAACGSCGAFACNAAKTAVGCNDPGPNACGGCGTLAAAPSAACGTCGTYACNAAKTAVTCNDPGANKCGGCGTLAGVPGAACGTCGTYACDPGKTSVNCNNDTGLNACGTCGTCVCPGIMCGSTCVASATDANNCGACGHGCLGGSCSGSLCQPIVLGTFTGNGIGLASDGSNLYFTNNRTSVYKCPTTGCSGGTPTPINSSFSIAGQIHYSSTHSAIYVSDIGSGDISSMTTSGAINWTTTFGGFSDPQGLSEDGSFVYVADDNVIDKVAKSNGAATKLGSGATGNVWSVAYDSVTTRVFGAVYNSSGAGEIVSCPVGGAACSAIALANQGRGYGIMLIGSTVYWVDGGNGSTGNSGGGLFSATASTLGNVQALASSGTTYGFALALTSDASFIYFTGGNSGDIYKCAIGGCSGAPSVIATGQGSARSILTDSSAVYWVNDAGQLMKVAK